MELSTLVSAASASEHYPEDIRVPVEHQPLQYTSPVKQSFGMSTSGANGHVEGYSPSHAAPPSRHNGHMRPEPRNVCFQLISAEHRARLPMRVNIFPHDTTESIVTTVKNFYGLYPSATCSKGVSFEDEQRNTLIARYENFHNNMTVYVRVTEEPASSNASFGATSYHPAAGVQGFLNSGEGYSMQAPNQFGPHIARPDSQASRKRSPSPNSGRGRRSASESTNPKARSRSSKTRAPGANSQGDVDSVNGYSSGDGAPGSSSGKNRDALGNTDISLENIVEGGRRKRAKFESSELPLFAPPQMPAATSNPSVSPARRHDQHRASLPFIHQGANPFTNPRMLQSPQNLHNGYGHATSYATPVQDHRRARSSISGSLGISGMGGILPTPDPTVGSCMSEEDKDVAMQLMRLGELSHISHGRTSASTQDDTFSGRADVTSSTGATSDAESDSDEEDMPPARKQRLDDDGNSKKIFNTTESHFLPTGGDSVFIRPDDDVAAAEGTMAAPKLKKIKTPGQNSTKPRSQSTSTKPKSAPKISKPKQPSTGSKIKKAAAAPGGPMSPNSLPASRKPSISSITGLPFGTGEDDQPDLSTKPRCQRCRKSKKGCDRQRPCGRCKDAGLPAEMCVSEDEGNGRKGRYGRHMGVPIAKDELPAPPALLPAAPIEASAIPSFAVAAAKDKKRKR